MAKTIVYPSWPVTGGVDTHLDVNVAAAVDAIGGLLGVAQFPTTSAGHAQLLTWLNGFGLVARVGVEGTSSYGTGLARSLRRASVEVVEVDRPNRQSRRRSGKSDPADAIEAARAALSGRAHGAAKAKDGNVEAIRALFVAKRSARDTRIETLNQIRHLGFTAPRGAERAPGGALSHAAGRRRGGPHGPTPGATRSLLPPRLRSAWSAGACWPSMPKRSSWTTSWPSWWKRQPPTCSACTAWAWTPPLPCSWPPVTTPGAYAPKQPGRTCAGRRPYRPRPAKSPVGASTGAATARRTRPCT